MTGETQTILWTLQSPQVFLQDAPAAATELPADIFASAGAVLEVHQNPLCHLPCFQTFQSVLWCLVVHLIMQALSTTPQIGIKFACNLQADDGLRQLRFRLVPKYCSEEQFWNRYFAAVERVKQQVKTEQMWGDFDMLDDDVIEAGGELVSPHCIVTV